MCGFARWMKRRSSPATHQPERSRARHEHRDNDQRDDPPVGPHQIERRVAVVDRQNADRQVARAASHRQGDDELHRPHMRNA